MPTRASDRVTLAVVASPTYVRTYYRMQASTASAPAAPTTNPPASPWSTTEPAYTTGSTDTLYTVQLVAYGSAAFEYGPVQKSSAYEAAKQAYNLALNANNAPGLLHGTAVPTTNSPSAPNGSVYFRHEGSLGGPMIASYSRVSGAWVETPLRILAGQIVGGEVIGLLIKTALEGKRVELLEQRLDFYDESGNLAGSIEGFYNGAAGLGVRIGNHLIIGTQVLPYGGSVQASILSMSIGEAYTRAMYDLDTGQQLHTAMRGTTAQRNAAFPTSTAAQRLALHNAQRQWYNTTTRTTDQYFTTPADGAVNGGGAVTHAGWYPVAGSLPRSRAIKTGGVQNFGNPTPSTLININSGEFVSGGITYNSSTDRWALPHAGFWRIKFGCMFSTNSAAFSTAILDAGGNSLITQFDRAGSGFFSMDPALSRNLPPGTEVRPSVTGSGITAICNADTFFFEIEYVGPPFF